MKKQNELKKELKALQSTPWRKDRERIEEIKMLLLCNPDPVHEPKEDENGSYDRDESDRKFYNECEINLLRNE